MVDRSPRTPAASRPRVLATPRILLVAANDLDAARIAQLVEEVPERDLELVRATSLVHAVSLLGAEERERPFTAVLLAVGHDTESILKLYTQLAQHTLGLPIVVATTPQREESARSAVLAGAMDYFLIGAMNGAKLVWSLENAVVGRDLEELTGDVRHELREAVRNLALCPRCETVRAQRHAGAELEPYVLPWSSHSTHHVVCPECARGMTRRSA